MNLTKFDKPVIDIFNDASLFLLSIVGGIALLMLVLSGIFYVFAGSNPEAQNKAKKTFNYAVIGLIIVLISYALIEVASNIGT